MKRKITGFLIVFLFTITTTMVMAVDRADYNSGVEKYKQKQNEDALSLFQGFVEQFPDSIKVDDAQWYMGRIYLRLNQEAKAELLFKEILLNRESNRFEEASYALGKILYARKLYSEVVDLLSFIDTTDELNFYHLKGLELSARAWYRLAYREKLAYNEKAAVEMFAASLMRYERLNPFIIDEGDQSRIDFAVAKIYSHLKDITYDPEQYQVYLDKSIEYLKSSLPMISDLYRVKAETMLKDMEASQKVRVNGRFTAYGGADNYSLNTYGADIFTKGSLVVPTLGRSSLSMDLSYKHGSFGFVASIFDPSKIGNAKFVQYSDTFGLDLTWKSGTRRNLYNKLNLFSNYKLAEDLRHNYLSAGGSDSGSVRFNRLWRFGWDSKFEWRTYPNYLPASGNKLDYIKGSLDPSIKFYGLDWVDISLLYGVAVKQYLASKYDTANSAVASAEDRSYLYNSGELVMDFQFSKIYNPVISYKFNYLKTYNYDYWVSGLPTNRYVEGYYDNISHTIAFDNNLKFNDKFKMFFGSKVIFTNFLNYPARDATKTFIDQLRSDTAVKLDLGANYLFWTSPGGIEMEGRLSGWWDYKISNMTYNTTFVTNYGFAGIMLGMSVRMP
ncbi:MAG: hypothetical protein L3J12_02430 [Spirochaetales bacterium]|nr:hypothetical protein [Spirochaetales bacterium]